MHTEECRHRAEQERSARLATLRPDGNIDLVPIVFGFVDKTLVFAVDHKPKSTQRLQRLDNIGHEPNVTVLFDHYADDWEQLWWVRMRGTATEVADEAFRATALDALAAKYAHYSERRPEGPVVRIDPSEWTGWSFVPAGADP